MSRDGWRPHIEGLRCLNLTRMLETEAVKPGNSTSGLWCWTDSETGERTAIVGYVANVGQTEGNLRLQYTVTADDGQRQSKSYAVRLTSCLLHFGGRRWYFHCPATGRRVLKLYLVQGTFVARTAIRPLPTYRSQRVSGLHRAIEQRWALRRKLDDTFSDLFGPPCKPKGMRWKTFERYAAKDERLASVEGMHFGRRLAQLQERLGSLASRLHVR